MDRGHQDLGDDLIHQRRRDQRRWAVGPHAAGVRTAVFIKGGLVVLRRFERDNCAAVGKGQNAGLFAVESFFDDHALPRVAKLLVAHDSPNGIHGDRLGGANGHSLAGCQAIGLDDERRFLAVANIRFGRFGVGKDLSFRGRNRRLPQHVFSEYLAPFELGGQLRRAEYPQPFTFEHIDHARHQRGLGADNCQLDFLSLGELDEPGDVGRANIDVDGVNSRTRVAGSAKHLRHQWRLRQLPDERVLASPLTDH